MNHRASARAGAAPGETQKRKDGKSPRILLLVRHATCGRNVLTGGGTDAPLNEEGRKQAAALAGIVRAKKPVRCFCSPMQRCRETAALALEGMNLQPEVDDDLREINFGLWEGLSFEEVMRDYPMDAAILARFDRHFVFPQGEAISTFLARVQRAVERMLASSEGPILAFTHGGVITAAICQVLGLHPRKHLLFVTRHASLTSLLVFGKRGVLMGMNESGVA